MGHLTPFLRLAASLVAHNVRLTLITAEPTVSAAESQILLRFNQAFPQVIEHKIFVPPLNETTSLSIDDPFTRHYEAIRHSKNIFSSMLSSLSPPVDAVITDMSLTSVIVPITKALGIPNYIFFTSSATMLAIYAIYHKVVAKVTEKEDHVLIIPGLKPIPKSWLPPPLLSESESLLKHHFIENGKKFLESDGILVNTLDDLEKESLRALNSSLVMNHLPPTIAIGPLPACEYENGEELAWLNDQPDRSVLYVSFGTRAALSKEQIEELGVGLVSSGHKFLWVVKGKTVDREEGEELEDMVRHDILDKVKQRGLVVKTWMNQEQILGHSAIGGFLSHCGWNSVTEAIWHGIPILAWPQNADQKINAHLVEKEIVGIWEKSWGWGRQEVIGGQEIAQKVKELMEDKELAKQASDFKMKARAAVEPQGSSAKQLIDLVNSLRAA